MFHATRCINIFLNLYIWFPPVIFTLIHIFTLVFFGSIVSKHFLHGRNTISCQGWHLSKSESKGWLQTHKAMSFALPLLEGKGLSLDTALYISHCQV